MKFDAIVVGAGPAGSTAALGLARAGWSVAIIEKAVFPRRKLCGEFMSGTNAAVFARLGLEDLWREAAGPPVTRVAVFAGAATAFAPMPRVPGLEPWGRAVGRDALDLALLKRAEAAGVTLFQPMRAIAFRDDEQGVICAAEGAAGSVTLRAPIAIAAHGSWEAGALMDEAPRPHAPGDLLAFKARLSGHALEPDLMPLIAFPGGYGGMAHVGSGLTSFSCCVRRDRLAQIRARHGGRAGDAVFAEIRRNCRGVAEATVYARPTDGWLAAGPIRPGIRPRRSGRVFRIGNAAGEAHPIVAEGVSMAIQSGWLLSNLLAQAGRDDLDRAARAYDRSWLAAFGPRIAASFVFAAIALRSGPAQTAAALLGKVPALLTLGARLSGKSALLAPIEGNIGLGN